MINKKINRILITGSSGFIGSSILQTALEEKWAKKIRVLIEKKHIKSEKFNHPGIEILTYSQKWTESILDQAIKNIEIIINASGKIGNWHHTFYDYYQSNYQTVRLLLESIKPNTVKKFIHISSPSVLGPINSPIPAKEDQPLMPQNNYEFTKATSENIIKSNCNIPWTILRPEFVYGPGDIHVIKLYQAVKNGRFVIPGKGDAFLQPTYITDVIDGIKKSLFSNKADSQIITLAGPEILNINSLTKKINKIFGGYSIKHLPLNFLRRAATLFEAISQFNFQPMINHTQIDFFTQNRFFNIAKAQKVFNWQPKISFSQGLIKTKKWLNFQDMENKITNIDFWYPYNLLEGEGLGSSYEYTAKSYYLKSWFKDKMYKKVIIAGLPGKYGFSLDIIFFFLKQGSNLLILDDRKQKIKRLKKIIKENIPENLTKKIIYKVTPNYNIYNSNYYNKFDKENLIINSEVIQNWHPKKLTNFLNKSKLTHQDIIFFIPNGDNQAHTQVSHIKSISFEQINKILKQIKVNNKKIKMGYLDTPPFPPGIKQSSQKKDKILNNKPLLFLIRIILKFWLKAELTILKPLLKKNAHLIYLKIKN